MNTIIIITIVALFLINHFISIAVKKKYKRENNEILKNIEKLNEQKK